MKSLIASRPRAARALVVKRVWRRGRRLHSLVLVSLHLACRVATSVVFLWSCSWAAMMAFPRASMVRMVGFFPSKGVSSTRNASSVIFDDSWCHCCSGEARGTGPRSHEPRGSGTEDGEADGVPPNWCGRRGVNGVTLTGSEAGEPWMVEPCELPRIRWCW